MSVPVHTSTFVRKEHLRLDPHGERNALPRRALQERLRRHGAVREAAGVPPPAALGPGCRTQHTCASTRYLRTWTHRGSGVPLDALPRALLKELGAAVVKRAERAVLPHERSVLE